MITCIGEVLYYLISKTPTPVFALCLLAKFLFTEYEFFDLLQPRFCYLFFFYFLHCFTLRIQRFYTFHLTILLPEV
jgi:hypothetical protein